MRITYGYGGWIRVYDDGVSGLLYLRLARDPDGLWQTAEMYLDSPGELSAALLRRLPLARIEAVATQGDGAARLERLEQHPGPQLSVMARAFATRHIGERPNCDTCGSLVDPRFGKHLDWLESSWWSQHADVEVRRPSSPPAKPPKKFTPPPPLSAPSEGLTEKFLRAVRAAYDAAVRQGVAPAPALAAQAGVPVRTVHRWVYVARQRGVMPAAARGKAGGRS